MEPTYQVDTPTSLRPDLAEYGIEEYDKGICLDTPENRATLRSYKVSWRAVYDLDGNPTDLIEVISPEMSEAKTRHLLDNRRALLQDPTDPSSDYVTGLDLLLVQDVDSQVPPWVIAATKRHRELERKQRENPDKKYRTQFQSPPARCRAIKSDGIRCMHWSAGRRDEGEYCRTHLLSKLTPERSAQALQTARRKIMQSAPMAADGLEQLAQHALSEPVRLKALTEMLDRAGVRGGIEIDQTTTVEVRPARELLAEKLALLVRKPESLAAAGLPIPKTDDEPEPETVTAEIVEDEDDGR